MENPLGVTNSADQFLGRRHKSDLMHDSTNKMEISRDVLKDSTWF